MSSAPAARSARAARSVAPESLRRFGGGRVGLFGEMLVVGMAVAGVSLAVVTVVPALAAGAHHHERHLSARGDALRDLLGLVREAFRGGWTATLAPLAAIALLVVNVSLGLQGLVPGGVGLAAVSAALALGIAVVLCRAAALWRPGSRWRAILREAGGLALSDPIGSLFIVLGLAVPATVTWMFAPLIVITPGMLALALVAAERRRRAGGPAS